jgi:hypothetical protein
MKRAQELVLTAEDSYKNLTESASAHDLNEWRKGEQQAQEGRAEDVKSMDYFDLKTQQGALVLCVDILC